MAQDDSITERKQLEQAIAHLEGQRSILGDSVVDAALRPLHEKLDHLIRKPTLAVAGDRRIVTILFCDVVGSTALAERMDPEVWTKIMNAAFEYLIEPIKRFSGTVARLMGDSVLAFFGAPVAHEDDPQRAVLAGLEIVRNISPFQEKLRNELGLDFNVRVGINTGLAVLGGVGSKEAIEYTAMGDAVNLAARMEQTAQPGTVQITHDTYVLISPLFDCKALGGITVKGKSKPVLAYQVLGRRVDPGEIRGLGGLGISSPLVGREKEFETIQGVLSHLLEGEGGILAILGEAGIGKSRLLSELWDQTNSNGISYPAATSPAMETPLPLENLASETRLIWLEGQSLAYGQAISYWPFQQILRQFASIGDDDSEPDALSKLKQSIHYLFQEDTIEILPYLASLLSLDTTEYSERLKYLDGEALGRQVYRACWRFFQRLAEMRRVVLVFDDLHWMDASSVGLLEHLMPLTERVPLLLCGLSRPESDSPAAKLLQVAEEYGNRFTVIELAPLSQTDSRQLIQNLLDIDGLPEYIRQMVLDKADGNPFYLEEIVRALIEGGAVVQETSTGRWRADQQIENVTVPDTIQGLLLARIDRLDEDLKRVVRHAAVIGRSFLYRILNMVVGEDPDLEQELDQLQNVELIREKQQLPEIEYIFKHALAHEAAYNSILLQERREVHARVGNAIEMLMTDRLEEYFGLLSYHYSAAEQWEKAQEYLLKAGDQAGRIAADSEALALYRQAMEAYGRVRSDDWEPLERASLERKIGEALYRLGEYSQVRAYFSRSLSLLKVTLPTSRWGIRLSLLSELVIQFAHRLFTRRFERSIGRPPTPIVLEIFRTLEAIGWIEAVTDIERFLLVAIKSLNISEKLGYAYGGANAAAAMASAIDVSGWHTLAGRYLRLARTYSRLVYPARPLLQLEWSTAFHYNLHAEMEKSTEYARRATESAQAIGDLRMMGSAKHLIAWTQYFQCRFNEAIETSLEMIQFAEEGSDSQVICWGLFGLGATQIRLGQIDEAIKSLQGAVKVAKGIPDYHTQAGAGAWLARCYLAQGELEHALAVLDIGEELLSTNNVIVNLPYHKNALSEAYLAAAEQSNGKEREDWLKKAERSCREAIKSAQNNQPPLPDALMLQGRYECLREKPAAAQKWWQKAIHEAQRIGDRYLEGTSRLEAGHRLGDRDQLSQAESIFQEIGAEFDLAKARKVIRNLSEI